MAIESLPKLNFSIPLSMTAALPIEYNAYFNDYNKAVAAAATAEAPGSSNTVYYYGQKIVVVTSSSADLYIIQPDKTLKLIDSTGSSYTLPIASSTTLGGVKPVTKTSDMTQSVGVDENGALYTAPGGGGGGTGSGDMLKSVYDPQDKSTDIFAYADNAANSRQAKILVDGILEGDGAGNISAADMVQAELLDVDIAPPFYVNCTIASLDSYDMAVVHDKTVAEVKAAYETGRPCYAIVEISGSTNRKFVLGLAEIGQTVIGSYATFATYEMYNGAFPSWHTAGFISIQADGTANGYLGDFQNDMLPVIGDDDNGKFLRASYGEWVAEDVDIVAPFYVNCNIDKGKGIYDKAVVHDKTLSEIQEAYQVGRPCYAIVILDSKTHTKWTFPLTEIRSDYAIFSMWEMYDGDNPDFYRFGYVQINIDGTAEGYYSDSYGKMYLPDVQPGDEGAFLRVDENAEWVAQQLTTEAWTFTLEDGSTVTKNIYIG